MNVKRTMLAATAAGGVVIFGCGHEITSPTLSAAPPLTPDLVCVAQKTAVTIKGDGMTPMPTSTLQDKAQLVLPTIDVTRVKAIDGSAASDAPITIPDDPANPAASHVSWTSPQQMAFDVYPDLKLTPGLYDVKVTNPDGSQAVSFPGGLAAIAAPSLTAAAPDLACDAEGDQSITVTGTNILILNGQPTVAHIGTIDVNATAPTGCVNVPGTLTEGQAQLCTGATFVIPKGALPAGTYDITLKNPAPADCSSSEKLSIAIVPPPTIKNLVPPAICDAEADESITINGSGFLQVGSALPSITIGTQSFPSGDAGSASIKVGGCTPVAGTFSEGAVQSCTSITLTVPKGTFTAGDYPVTVQNPKPAACKTLEMVSLHDESPPTVTSVAPQTVCTGGGNVTIDGTGFIATPTVSLQAQNQPTVTSTSVQMNAAGTQLTAKIGGGATAGVVYDVVVQNPDGCSDLPPHKQINVVPGPIIFMADPQVVYNGVNMRVTVYGTGITGAALPTISIVPTGQAAPVTNLTVNAVTGHPNRFQVVIPKGQAAGVYDMTLTDQTGCPAVLSKAITVTATTTITVKNVLPPFGATTSETAITIFRDKTAPAPNNQVFVATPRAFLNPTNPQPSDIATPLESVAFVDQDTLTAVVPAGTLPHGYDLIVTNPDGTVGFLASAYTETTAGAPPPTITSVTPSSIVNAAGQSVTVAGTNFRASTITVSCRDAGGIASTPPVTSGTPNCNAQQVCTQTATIDASSLTTTGTVCVLRVTNSDATYADYSAIGVTGPSLNLEKPPKQGTTMTTGRRALVASAVDATSAARFVYAIGGDGGAASAPFNTSEFASVDVFGNMGAWQPQRYDIGGARAFAGTAKMGRYTYMFGGTDGTNNLNTARRAMTLSPREVPALDVNDLQLAATGLDAGYWFYKVVATFAANDPDNPGGDSLPSDEFILRLPSFPGKKIQVILTWAAPVDSQGNALPNVSGYKVYRTAAANGASGGEVLIATINGGSTLTFTDDGSATPGTEKPLPLGSMGKWAALPNMNVVRKGPAGAAALDPTNANQFYVYAMLGVDANGIALGSYELLRVTIAANGHQTVAASWTNGAGTLAPRWQAGAFVADSTVSTTIAPPDTYVFVGGGISGNNAAVNNVDVGKVVAGSGDLGTFAASQSFNGNSAGYGACAANNQLFAFGGANHAPSNGAISARFTGTAPALANNSWNSEGIQLLQPRYLMGSTVQSAFIFLVGGDTGGGNASNTTELVIW